MVKLSILNSALICYLNFKMSNIGLRIACILEEVAMIPSRRISFMCSSELRIHNLEEFTEFMKNLGYYAKR
jgi:hypothetical protein